MPVTPESKHALRDLFTRMEALLKRTAGYLQGGEGERATANWQRFGSDIGQQLEPQVTHRSREVLTTLRPMREIVRNGVPAYDTNTPPLQGGQRRETLGKRLIEASVRVRNNVVHDGKEDPELERHAGHDQAVVDAALEVLGKAERVLQQLRR